MFVASINSSSVLAHLEATLTRLLSPWRPIYPPRVCVATQEPTQVRSLPTRTHSSCVPHATRPEQPVTTAPTTPAARHVRLDPLSYLTADDVAMLNATTGSSLSWPVGRRSADVFPVQAVDVGMLRGLHRYGHAPRDLVVALQEMEASYLQAGTRYPHTQWLHDAVAWMLSRRPEAVVHPLVRERAAERVSTPA